MSDAYRLLACDLADTEKLGRQLTQLGFSWSLPTLLLSGNKNNNNNNNNNNNKIQSFRGFALLIV